MTAEDWIADFAASLGRPAPTAAREGRDPAARLGRRACVRASRGADRLLARRERRGGRSTRRWRCRGLAAADGRRRDHRRRVIGCASRLPRGGGLGAPYDADASARRVGSQLRRPRASARRRARAALRPLARALRGARRLRVPRPEPVGCLVLGEDPAPLRDEVSCALPALRLAGLRLARPRADLAREEPGLAPDFTRFRWRRAAPFHRRRRFAPSPSAPARPGAELLERSARGRPATATASPASRRRPPVSRPAVVIAAGPWSGELGPRSPSLRCGASSPRCALAAPPRHVLEEAGTKSLVEPPATRLFSLITLGDGHVLARVLVRRAGAGPRDRRGRSARPRRALRPRARGRPARPAAALRAAALGRRPPAARARSRDRRAARRDRPRPWGVTLGPASAELVAAAVLDPVDRDRARTGRRASALTSSRWRARRRSRLTG